MALVRALHHLLKKQSGSVECSFLTAYLSIKTMHHSFFPGAGGAAYYLYHVHISMSFLHNPTLASSLYMLWLRLAARDYASAARLVDSIGTDVDFSPGWEGAHVVPSFLPLPSVTSPTDAPASSHLDV